jgi:hypothetical protein
LVLSEVFQSKSGNSRSYNVIRPFVGGDGLNITKLNIKTYTFSLFYELLASLIETTRQRELLPFIPPKYQVFVPPSPIYISEAVFKAFSFKDLQDPIIPLILSSLETLMVR